MSKTNSKLKVVSLFTGLGGLDLGFLWGGFEIIWSNDILKNAALSYDINFGTPFCCEDITKVPFSEIPDADIIIGGPPCQSFSLMGQRAPDDPRGKLVFHFLEAVKRKRPRAFLMENVPGMAASHIQGKRLPEYLKTAFSDLGYKVTLLTLTATDYMVPQLRKRLVLVGTLSSTPRKPDGGQFLDECYGIKQDQKDISSKGAIGDLGDCVKHKSERSPYRDVEPSIFAGIMRKEGGKDVSLHLCPRMSNTDLLLVKHIPPGGNYQDIPDDIAPGRVLKYKKTGGRTTTYGRLHPDKPAYTINTYFRRPNVGTNFHYAEPRLITPREAMRFQSIPDHFEVVFSSQDGRNALIGNAVPPLMAQALAWELKNALKRDNENDETLIQSSLF